MERVIKFTHDEAGSTATEEIETVMKILNDLIKCERLLISQVHHKNETGLCWWKRNWNTQTIQNIH